VAVAKSGNPDPQTRPRPERPGFFDRRPDPVKNPFSTKSCNIKKAVLMLALAAMFAPSVSNAQVKIDMGTLTCGDYLAMSPELEKFFPPG
jgi:hypothetical protein